MDDATLAELEDLRARAYGPGADIDSDPVAVARLRELEDAARGGVTAAASGALDGAGRPGHTPTPRDAYAPVPPMPPLPPRPAPAHPPAAASAERSGTSGSVGPAAAVDPAEPLAPTRSRRRLVRVLWPVSVVVAVLLTAGVMSLLFPPGGLSASQREVATLRLSKPTPGETLFGTTTGVHVTAHFHGLTVFRSVGLFDSGDAECLTVYQTPRAGADASSIEGAVSYGCAAGALPAIVQVSVDGTAPQALQDAFSAGTGLRFELHGDRVRVIADSSVDAPAS